MLDRHDGQLLKLLREADSRHVLLVLQAFAVPDDAAMLDDPRPQLLRLGHLRPRLGFGLLRRRDQPRQAPFVFLVNSKRAICWNEKTYSKSATLGGKVVTGLIVAASSPTDSSQTGKSVCSIVQMRPRSMLA